ncbi:hypothetical protein M5K25_004574 [Dendrobium thyrsiflorum]|uniref:Uncharacterized protein n=1 Tax=Dendrobium thyrsiflorum TaxID=117978 RepID=A0ABD0VFS0_DENTH
MFARVYVLINKDSLLPEEVNISVDGNVFSLKIVYDWKPIPCSGCGSIVHPYSLCPTKHLETKGNEVETKKGKGNRVIEFDRGRSKIERFGRFTLILLNFRSLLIDHFREMQDILSSDLINLKNAGSLSKNFVVKNLDVHDSNLKDVHDSNLKEALPNLNSPSEETSSDLVELSASFKLRSIWISLKIIGLMWNIEFFKTKQIKQDWAYSKNISTTIDYLQKLQEELLDKIQVNPLDKEINMKLKEVNRHLNFNLSLWSSWITQRAKAKWLTSGEDDLSFLYSKIHHRQNMNKINVLYTFDGIISYSKTCIRKIHIIAWKDVCNPKKVCVCVWEGGGGGGGGGLGIPDPLALSYAYNCSLIWCILYGNGLLASWFKTNSSLSLYWDPWLNGKSLHESSLPNSDNLFKLSVGEWIINSTRWLFVGGSFGAGSAFSWQLMKEEVSWREEITARAERGKRSYDFGSQKGAGFRSFSGEAKKNGRRAFCPILPTRTGAEARDLAQKSWDLIASSVRSVQQDIRDLSRTSTTYEETLDPKHFLSNWYQSIDSGPWAAEFLKFQRLIRLRRKKIL